MFSHVPYAGNPVAVVLDAGGLSADQMQRFARWMNLSETTFVLPPTRPEADYRVRIFTPMSELPFAGHPTLGTCHAWTQASGDGGGRSHPGTAGRVVIQECGAGLIRIRRDQGRWAFQAPPLLRGGPVDESLISRVATILRIPRQDILEARWADNGPGWVAVLLADAAAVLALSPGFVEDLYIGVVATLPPGAPAAVEVRAFFPVGGATVEDPVTGSLNAALAAWLIDSGRVRLPYVAHQGTAVGRDGMVHLAGDPSDDDVLWVGGSTVTCIEGLLDL